MKKHLGSIIKGLLGLIISTFLIIYLINSIDYNKVLKSLENVAWSYFLLALIMSLFSHISRGLRWAILLEDQGLKVNRFGLIAGTYFGYFINIIIPRGGELARCTSVSYKYGLPTDKLLGTIVLERVIDLLILIFCVALLLFLDIDLFGNFFYERWEDLNSKFSGLIPLILGLCVVGVIGLIVLIRLRHKFGIFKKLYEFVRGIIGGLLSLRQLKRKGLFIFHTFFIWTMYLLMAYLPFKAFAETSHYDFTKGLFVFILGGIGMTIPTPGGIGSYHAAVILGMTEVLNESIEIASAYAFSVHALLTILTVLTGITSGIILFKRGRHESTERNQ